MTTKHFPLLPQAFILGRKAALELKIGDPFPGVPQAADAAGMTGFDKEAYMTGYLDGLRTSYPNGVSTRDGIVCEPWDTP